MEGELELGDQGWPVGPYRKMKRGYYERLLREVICKVIHLCVNIGGVDVKLKMGFNKDHATKHVHNALVFCLF